jgi:hypothetical protein
VSTKVVSTPRRFGQNRLCPVGPRGLQRPFSDASEGEPLLLALAVELLREERVARYHLVRSLCPM